MGESADEFRKCTQLHEGDQRAQLLKAFTCYEYALAVWHREVFPEWWAVTQSNKRVALSQLAKLPDCTETEQVELLHEAIASYNGALAARCHEAPPTNWEKTPHYKSPALPDLTEPLAGADCVQALRDTVACYESWAPILRGNLHQLDDDTK